MMKVALAVLPCEKGKYSVQTDALLPRCGSIISKASYALPPIGLMYVSSILRQRAGCRVSLIDCVVARQTEGQLIEFIRSESPNALIFATGASTFEHDKKLLERVKRIFPSLILIAVGGHATILAEEVLGESHIDFVIRGEPELTAADLIGSLSRGGSCDGVDGIAFKRNGTIVITPPRKLLENIDELPFPARDLTARYKYAIPFAKSNNFTIMLTSRGCPYPCIFCATRIYDGSRCRMRTADNIIAELDQIVRTSPIRDVGFWDDTFTLRRSHVVGICTLIIQRRLEVDWICLSRVDTVDGDLLRLMKRAGCYQIQYGVESGDQRILDSIQKGITIEQVKKAFQETRRSGIETVAFFMFGCPGETVETMEKTIALAKELDADYASFNIVTPYPGTRLYEIYQEQIKGNWRNFDGFHVAIKNELSPEDIRRYLRRAYRVFYFRPLYMLRRISHPASLGKIIRQIRVGWQLFLKFVTSGG